MTIIARSDTTIVGHAVSNQDGTFALGALRPGVELQLTKLGYLPKRISVGSAQAADSILLILHPTATTLPTVRVTDRNFCGGRGDSRDKTLRILEAASALIQGPRLTNAQQLTLRVLELRGAEDGPVRLDGQLVGNSRDRNTEVDSSLARTVDRKSLFGGTPPETLAVRGYVRQAGPYGATFDAPNVEHLLSEWFMATHCWTVRDGGNEDADSVGVAFRSTHSDETFADVEGVLWLNADMSRMLSLDFTYTHLRNRTFSECVAFKATCMRRHQITNEGTGGSLRFAYLRTGEWFLNGWTLRGPAHEYVTRDAGFGLRPVRGRGLQRCIAGPDCQRLNAPVPRLELAIGAVATVVVDDAEVYSDSAVLAAIARQVRRSLP